MKTTTLAYFLIFIFSTSACSQVSSRSINHSTKTYSNHSQHSLKQQSKSYHKQRSQRTSKKLRKFKKSATIINNYQMNNHPNRNLMVQIAKNAIGTPYKWGGNNPQQGFDCSGLMTYIHKNALGIRIPRTAAKQRNNSRTISYAQLQPGDMLFFKTGRKTNHVGIYVGNREFIHAPSGGKPVRVSTMDSSYWYNKFVKFGTFL